MSCWRIVCARTGRYPQCKSHFILFLLLVFIMMYFLTMVTLHAEQDIFRIFGHRPEKKIPNVMTSQRVVPRAAPEADSSIKNLDLEIPFTPPDFIPRRNSKAYRWPEKGASAKIFKTWQQERKKFCGGHFVGYAAMFARLQNVLIAAPLETGRPVEHSGVPFASGLRIPGCASRFAYHFNDSSYLNEWLASTNHSPDSLSTETAGRTQTDIHFNIAITRHEDTMSLYHTLADVYNIFLMMAFFNKTQEQTRVVIVDKNPESLSDVIWTALFGSVVRFSRPGRKALLYKDLVWSIPGLYSPIHDHYASTEYLLEEMELIINPVDNIPLLNTFRETVLETFGMSYHKSANCSQLSIVFLRSVMKANGTSSFLPYQVKNDEELLYLAREGFPSHRIGVLRTDLLTFRRQLEVITGTDILFSVHNSWLAHTLFLPSHAAVVEFVPSRVGPGSAHFEALATWRGVRYKRWDNVNPRNEFPNHRISIPPDVFITYLRDVINEICPDKVRVTG